MIYDFGYRLKELREKKNLTQAQVARRLHLSRTSISNYENNVKVPSLDVVCRLALLYNSSIDYIMGLSAEDNREVIVVEGLTQRQRKVIETLIDALKNELKE